MNIRSLAAAVLLVASLGACSSAESVDGSEETTGAPTTTQDESESPSSPETSSDSANEGEETGSPSNEELDLDFSVNERGNIPMNFDESGYVTHIHYEKPLVQFHIESIESNFTCTNPSARESDNGNFLALRMQVETQPELADTEVPQLEFSTYDFRVMGPDGSIQINATGKANDCITDDEKLPETIRAGEYVSGMIILDSEHESGHLIFAPHQFGDRWEWTF